MKKTITSIFITLLLVLTVINLVFLVEIYKDDNLNKFFYKGENLPNDYTDKEKIHMQEVKDLVIKGLIISLALILMLFVLKPNSKILKTSGYLGLLITGLFIFFAIFFQNFFHYFHVISFNSTNWLLPIDSKLIQDYPFEYFKNMFLVITGLLAILSTILINNKRIKKLWDQ
jgi:integral membrane protein (TIGR01906 family)